MISNKPQKHPNIQLTSYQLASGSFVVVVVICLSVVLLVCLFLEAKNNNIDINMNGLVECKSHAQIHMPAVLRKRP